MFQFSRLEPPHFTDFFFLFAPCFKRNLGSPLGKHVSNVQVVAQL